MEVSTREQLLDGLYYVHRMMERMQGVMAQYIRLEREFTAKLQYVGLQQRTEEIKTNTVKSKSKLLVIAISITIAVFYLLLSMLFHSDANSALLYLVPAAIMVFANKKPKLKIAATVFEILMIVWFIQILFQSAPPLMAAIVLVLLAVVVVAEVFFIRSYNLRYVTSKNREADKHNKAIIAATDAKNAEIEQYNRLVSTRRNELYDKYADLRDELWENTCQWFPPDYYSMVAVEHFIKSVRNHKASTVKEMVALFDESQYRDEVLAYQRKQSQQFDTIIRQNEDIKRNQAAQEEHMRLSNMMQAMDMGRRDYYARRQEQGIQSLRDEAAQTRSAIDRNTDALNRLRR